MSENVGFVRVADNDPNRCQAVHRDYQCPFRAVGTFDPQTKIWTGPKYCIRHGGRTQETQAKAANLRLYNLAKYQAQMESFADSPRAKSLKEEIGILRMMLQTRLNEIKSNNELVLHSNNLTMMIREIANTVKICDTIDARVEKVIDKSKAQIFINSIIEIIGKYVNDPDLLLMISDEMEESLEKVLT